MVLSRKAVSATLALGLAGALAGALVGPLVAVIEDQSLTKASRPMAIRSA
jgi:hypothetical protein